jgi:hypothetical protein
MDLKLIVIILVLLGILYIIKELITIKKETIKLSEFVDNTINNIKGLKNRLNVVTSEIKNYNNDLVIQVKKINSINSQIVTSMSNYYTESESDGNKNLIDYLSDAKKTDTEFKINFSENRDDKYKKNLSENKNKQDINSHKSHKSEKSKTSSTPSILPSIPLVIASNLNSETSQDEEIVTNKSKDKKEDIKEDNKNESLVIGMNTCEISTKDAENKESEESDEQSEDSEDSEEEVEVEEEIEVTDNGTGETEVEEVIEEITMSSSKSSHSSKSGSSGSIKLDNITIGSSVANKGKKLEINDTKSIDTNNILTMTKLNPINTYNKQNLEQIAKILSIPITYNDENNIRKPYKKDELYSKIKDFINKKSK